MKSVRQRVLKTQCQVRIFQIGTLSSHGQQIAFKNLHQRLIMTTQQIQKEDYNSMTLEIQVNLAPLLLREIKTMMTLVKLATNAPNPTSKRTTGPSLDLTIPSSSDWATTIKLNLTRQTTWINSTKKRHGIRSISF